MQFCLYKYKHYCCFFSSFFCSCWWSVSKSGPGSLQLSFIYRLCLDYPFVHSVVSYSEWAKLFNSIAFKKKNHFVYLLIYYSFPLEMCEILMLISLEPVLLWILNTCPDKTRMSNTQKWARVMKVKKTDVKGEKRARAGDQSHLIFWISIIKKK